MSDEEPFSDSKDRAATDYFCVTGVWGHPTSTKPPIPAEAEMSGEPVEKPVIANQSAFLVWQSPNFSGQKLIGSTLKLGDSHASVRTGSE